MILSSPVNGYFLKEFGIDETLCRKLLSKALSRGGDFADLYFEHTLSNFIGLEDGKVNRLYGEITLGVGIRTVKGDQVGYGFTQELTEESMLSVAATAASLCDASATAFTASGNPGPHRSLLLPVHFVALRVKMFLLSVRFSNGSADRMRPSSAVICGADMEVPVQPP